MPRLQGGPIRTYVGAAKRTHTTWQTWNTPWEMHAVEGERLPEGWGKEVAMGEGSG